MSHSDTDSDSDDLLPPPKTLMGGNKVRGGSSKRRRSLVSEDEMDLIDTGYLKDTRKINDQLIESALKKQSTPVVDMRTVKVVEELNDNGAHKEFKEGDEEVKDILNHGASKFLFVYRDLKLEPPKGCGIRWDTSIDPRVLKLLIKRRNKLSEPIPQSFDLGMIQGFTPILKYNHYNSTGDVNILRVKMYILDRISKGQVDDQVYDIFFWTLCDYNLNRYSHELLVDFSQMFTELSSQHPKNIGEVVNGWDLKYFGEESETNDIDEVKYELWFHILQILNLHPSPEAQISIRHFLNTDLTQFFSFKPTLENIHKRHMDLRLLPLEELKDVQDLKNDSDDIFKLKKKYQELMSTVTFGGRSNDKKQDLLKLLHEDYLYLNYYEIKFKQYQNPNPSYDY